MKIPEPSIQEYIYSETRLRVSGDRKSYTFGKTVYPPGGHFGPRIQKDFQLVVLLSGSLRVTVDETTHTLAPGEAILNLPGDREFYRFSPDVASTHTWCQVTPRLLSSSDREQLARTRGVYQAPAAVHLLIDEGLVAPARQDRAWHTAMGALARACLLRFAAAASSSDLRETEKPLHPALQRALEIATAHFPELRSSEDLARRAGISASRLRMLFREAGSESPNAMIWRLKAQHAIQLIRSTGLTLNEIAGECGYANPFHLSRSVRRHTGHSPRDLRDIEWKK